jgi:hypothetical protein
MFTQKFWRAAAGRAMRSAAQGFLTSVGTAVTGWMELNWVIVGITTGGMAVLSVANSIIMSPPEAE